MLIFCPNCNGSLSARFLERASVEGSCPTCATVLGVTLFPALFRPRTKIDAQNLQTAEGEASCYEHANKRAVAVCNRCGRFLCALCEVAGDAKVWCPNCLNSGQSGGPIQAIERQRTLYDSIALALAFFPALLFFYPSILTAPVVIFLSIRYWKKPSSIIPRGKWRFVLALLIVLAEVGLVVLAVFAIIFSQRMASVPK